MTVLGVINVDGIQSSDTRDMIAAFRGTECVGVAHPQYFSRYDSYMVLLTVYGGQQTASLTYKFYDASTGIVYPSVSVSNQQAYTFVSDRSIGTFANPVIFTPLNEIEQDLSHNAATWKWFSLYAQPKVNDVSVVFQDARDAIVVVTDGTNTLINWTGTLRSFAYSRMYKLQAVEPYEETLIGEPTDPTLIDITLNANGWTWMGYPVQAANSLDAALAEAEPLEGDMVKNQSGFALYTEGEWLGTLQALTPGDGYMYYSHAAAAKTFRFPKPTSFGRTNAPARMAAADFINPQAADNMTMIAQIAPNLLSEQEMDQKLMAYIGNNLVGVAAPYTPSEATPLRDACGDPGRGTGGVYFLTIQSDAVGTLRFETADGTSLTAVDDATSRDIDISYSADTHYGTMKAPVLLRPAEESRPYKIIENDHVVIIRNSEKYDVTGKKL